MSIDNKIEKLFNCILLFALVENEQKEWDQLRNKETELLKLAQQEYSDYFNRLFEYGIPDYSLKSDTPLFRARQIKNSDISKLGVNISDVIESYFKIILTDEDIEEMEKLNNSSGVTFNLQHFFILKALEMGKFSEEQQQKIDELMKRNTIQKVYGFSEKESRVPPPSLRKAGRLNTALDAYLYVAFDRDTAIHEMRPSIGQQYSLAEFRSNKETKIADLTGSTIAPEKNNIPLWSLANKISEPNTDNTDIFYHITQHMAHMLQEKGYDGIMYKSALKKGKNNILLFDEANVDFIASEIVEINDVNIDYSNILPFSNNPDE